MKERDISIDILKGMGILLVLAAHTLEGVLSQVAYTFHMPLFFIVCGLFFSNRTPLEMVNKDFQRLIIPALFTTGVIVVVWFCKGYDLSAIKNQMWVCAPDERFGHLVILGNMWFLYAMFWTRISFCLLQTYCTSQKLGIACLICGYVAYWIGFYMDLPFMILQGLSYLPYIWLGFYVKQHGGTSNGIPKWVYWLILLWVVYVSLGVMRMDWIKSGLGYLPKILAATGGTLLCYLIAKTIESRTKYTRSIFAFLGVYSLILICVPAFEYYCFPLREVIPADLSFRTIIFVVGKVLWCALAFYLCLKLPFLRKIYCGK